MARARAILYSKQACPFCVAAKQLLEQKNIEYVAYDIEQDLTARDMLFEHVPNARTVPQIFIDGEYVGGFQQLKERFNNVNGTEMLLG